MALYCFEHEAMFQEVSTEACPAAHDIGTITVITDGVVMIESNYCCFDMGYATCPPPDEFAITGTQNPPTDEEIAGMNSTATELYTTW